MHDSSPTNGEGKELTDEGYITQELETVKLIPFPDTLEPEHPLTTSESKEKQEVSVDPDDDIPLYIVSHCIVGMLNPLTKGTEKPKLSVTNIEYTPGRKLLKVPVVLLATNDPERWYVKVPFPPLDNAVSDPNVS